jgi:hypothetical protein
MTRFVRLPMKVLVEPDEVAALRKKFAEAQTLVNHERFWLEVQRRRQPVIQDNEDTFVVPSFIAELPIG